MNTTPVPETYYDDEIDLLDSLETIWQGRTIVLAIVVTYLLLATAYVVFWPTNYQGLLTVSETPQKIITDFISINERLVKNGYDPETDYISSINTQGLFSEFITEFNDYQEIIAAVKSHSSVYKAFQGSEKEQRELLIKLAKQFSLQAPNRKRQETQWFITYKWNSIDEASKILKQALTQINTNIKKTTLDNLKKLVTNLKLRQQLAVEKLNHELAAQAKKIEFRIQKKILYLSEQAAIARQLNLAKGTISANNLQKKQTNGVAVTVRSDSTPIYLQGYHAIEKELQLIRDRSKEENYSLDNTYIVLQERLIDWKNSVDAQQLQQAIDTVPFDTKSLWIPYDTALTDIKGEKKLALLFTLALFSGIVSGSLWVLFRNALYKRKCKRELIKQPSRVRIDDH